MSLRLQKKAELNELQLIFFVFFRHGADTSDLREPEQVRACQEKALHALQTYTLGHYPDAPSKFGELLLRIPELQRTCQVRIDSSNRLVSTFFIPTLRFFFGLFRLARKC